MSVINFIIHSISNRFYPLIPSHETVSIEYEQLYQHGKLDNLPHLFITSSDLRPFIKVFLFPFIRIISNSILLFSLSIQHVQ